MNIPKAIKTLQEEVDSGISGTMFDLHDAQKLGIEALKREKFNRDNPKYIICGRLAGETEE